MSNQHRDILSVVVADQDIRDVKAKLDAIEQVFPFLIELTADEIIQLPRINVANHSFVQDIIQVLETLPVPLPDGISRGEIKKDLDLYDQLDGLSIDYETMLKKLRNTATLAGSEAYKSALFVYRIIQTYAEASIPGYGAIYERLKQRFAAQGPRETAANTNNTTQNANNTAQNTNNTANSNDNTAQNNNNTAQNNNNTTQNNNNTTQNNANNNTNTRSK